MPIAKGLKFHWAGAVTTLWVVDRPISNRRGGCRRGQRSEGTGEQRSIHLDHHLAHVLRHHYVIMVACGRHYLELRPAARVLKKDFKLLVLQTVVSARRDLKGKPTAHCM